MGHDHSAYYIVHMCMSAIEIRKTFNGCAYMYIVVKGAVSLTVSLFSEVLVLTRYQGDILSATALPH